MPHPETSRAPRSATPHPPSAATPDIVRTWPAPRPSARMALAAVGTEAGAELFVLPALRDRLGRSHELLARLGDAIQLSRRFGLIRRLRRRRGHHSLQLRLAKLIGIIRILQGRQVRRA